MQSIFTSDDIKSIIRKNLHFYTDVRNGNLQIKIYWEEQNGSEELNSININIAQLTEILNNK